MHQYGWRATAFTSGLIALVVGLPLATVIQRRPQDHGETIDGLPEPPVVRDALAVPASAATGEFTVAQALRTRTFWLLALVVMLMTVGQVGGVLLGVCIGERIEKRYIAGPLVAGVLADLTGNYRVGFTTLALVSGCGSVLFLLARKPQWQ